MSKAGQETKQQGRVVDVEKIRREVGVARLKDVADELSSEIAKHNDFFKETNRMLDLLIELGNLAVRTSQQKDLTMFNQLMEYRQKIVVAASR